MTTREEALEEISLFGIKAPQIYSMVFPGDANVAENKISVLAPIGTALIGYRVGDTIEWKVLGGLKKLKVEEILYQPERAGDYHL